MNVFISDKLIDKRNIHSYNGQMLQFILKHKYNNCIIIFIKESIEPIDALTYLEKNDIIAYSFWKNKLSILEKYSVFVSSKEKLKQLLDTIPNITNFHFFAAKKNISYDVYNCKKTLYLNENDTLTADDYAYFNNIYSFNNYQSNDVVEFINYELERAGFPQEEGVGELPAVINSVYGSRRSLFTHQLEAKQYIKNGKQSDNNVIFLHVIDFNFELFDRIIYAVEELKRFNIHLIVYMPKQAHINILVQKSKMTFDKDTNSLQYNYNNNTKTISFLNTDEIHKLEPEHKLNVQFNIEDSISQFYLFNRLLIDCKISYEIIEKPFNNDNELREHIYAADIYIPLSNEFCDLSLFAQKCKTYCLFLNDGFNAKEYCIYGDIPTSNTNDYYFNVDNDRIEKVLRVKDVIKSFTTFFENKENPFFTYKKEIASILF